MMFHSSPNQYILINYCSLAERCQQCYLILDTHSKTITSLHANNNVHRLVMDNTAGNGSASLEEKFNATS